jgi:hypothetical protein
MKRIGRVLLPAAAALLLALAVPAMASANDYCVQASCPGTDVNTIEDAFGLAKKSADADRIFLGAHDYKAQALPGFVYDGAGPIEIIGAGNGTVLTGEAGGTGVLSLIGGAGSSVHDLTIQLPQYFEGRGLYTSNLARRIEVGEHQDQSHPREGVRLVGGGTLEVSDVSLVREANTTAVAFGSGGGAVRDTSLNAGTGVLSRYGDSLIDGSLVRASGYGIRALGGVTTIRSSRVHLISTQGSILRAEPQTSSATVNADSNTLTMPAGNPGVVGAVATTSFDPSLNASVNLTNSIVRGGGGALLAQGPPAGASGHARITASYSDYDPSLNATSGIAEISEANVSNVGDAGFADIGLWGYHLLPTSPLVDAGDPGITQGLDFARNLLVTDGNGDGIARRDIGAYELAAAPAGPGGPGGASPDGGGPAPDTTAPLVTGFKAMPAVFAIARAGTPASARAARGTRLRYILSEPARVTVALKRAVKRAGHLRYRSAGSLRRSGSRGANTIRFSGRIGKRALRPGLYRAVIRATDAAGNRSAAKRIRLRITAR